ncbi:MAG: HPr(Ser) kinase/phosphatase [Deltaproteobacteria bacterium]|nr:HPr(Ser) kinase/phosphatase [Deltaproteobacteria bacterium]
MAYIPVEEILGDAGEGLDLSTIAGQNGLTRRICGPYVQQPGLAMAGYLRHVVGNRVQVLDRTELGYLSELAEESARKILADYFAKQLCCVVVTHNLAPPDMLTEIAEATKTPLLRTKHPTQEFIGLLTAVLEYRFARRTTIHGVLMDVDGVGLLILGKSAIGKSECALDLILKGHRLVADDIVELRRVGPDRITGRGSEITQFHMEIRGLGIINIKEMFGIGAIRERKRVHIIVKFVEWNDDTEYERIGLDEQYYQILGVDLPMLTIPVRPGRNMTAIVEVAARNHLLKMEGYNAAKAFQDSLLDRIAGGDGGDGEDVD